MFVTPTRRTVRPTTPCLTHTARDVTRYVVRRTRSRAHDATPTPRTPTAANRTSTSTPAPIARETDDGADADSGKSGRESWSSLPDDALSFTHKPPPVAHWSSADDSVVDLSLLATSVAVSVDSMASSAIAFADQSKFLKNLVQHIIGCGLRFTLLAFVNRSGN